MLPAAVKCTATPLVSDSVPADETKSALAVPSAASELLEFSLLEFSRVELSVAAQLLSELPQEVQD